MLRTFQSFFPVFLDVAEMFFSWSDSNNLYYFALSIFWRVRCIKESTASISDLSVKTQNHSCLFLNAENTLSTSALRELSQITDITLLRVMKTDWNQFSLTLYLPECTICHGISLDHNCKSWSNNLACSRRSLGHNSGMTSDQSSWVGNSIVSIYFFFGQPQFQCGVSPFL